MRKTADAIVFLRSKNKYQVLLVKRKNPPFQGEWAFPGGFIDANEDPLHACLRELYEETDLILKEEQARSLCMRQKSGRDPRGDTHTYPYLFILENNSDGWLKIKAKDDAAAAKWVDLDKIERLAFDHGAILCEALGILFPLSAPQYKDQEVVFFGGSFNPWHAGHTECVKLFLKDYPDKLLVVVPDTSPWKSAVVSKEHVCYYQALKVLKHQLEPYPVVIHPGFYGKETPNPTAYWFEKITARKKGLLMGDDQFACLKNWENASTLISMMDFLFVVPRHLNNNECDLVKNEILTLNHNIEIIILSDHEYRHISSTKLRNNHEKR